jgi:hypothetical protein
MLSVRSRRRLSSISVWRISGRPRPGPPNPPFVATTQRCRWGKSAPPMFPRSARLCRGELCRSCPPRRQPLLLRRQGLPACWRGDSSPARRGRSRRHPISGSWSRCVEDDVRPTTVSAQAGQQKVHCARRYHPHGGDLPPSRPSGPAQQPVSPFCTQPGWKQTLE